MHALARAVTGSTPARLSRRARVGVLAVSHRASAAHSAAGAVLPAAGAAVPAPRRGAAPLARRARRSACVTALQAIASVYYGLMTGVVLAVSARRCSPWRPGSGGAAGSGRGCAAAVLAVGLCRAGADSVRAVAAGRRASGGRCSRRRIIRRARRATRRCRRRICVYGTTGLLDAASRRGRAGAIARQSSISCFPGLVLLALAGVGLWRNWRRDARPLALSCARAGRRRRRAVARARKGSAASTRRCTTTSTAFRRSARRRALR